MIFRDRKHWFIRVGRCYLRRWCTGVECGYLSVRYTKHPIALTIGKR